MRQLGRTVAVVLALVGGANIASASDPCVATADREPIFESCEAWESPFENHHDWLQFMAEGVSTTEVAALAESWTEEEFEAWRSETRGTVQRVTFRSQTLRLRALLVRPQIEGPLPAVVYARGGNRQWGRLRFLDIVRMQQIASTGRIVLAPEYRGEGGSEGEPELAAGDVDDALEAASRLRAWSYVDGSEIDVLGLSRGGLVEAWALEHPTPFRSAILLAPNVDLVDAAARRPEMDEHVYRLSVPGYSDDRAAALESRSPLNGIARLADVPVLLLHAIDDARVHPSGSLAFASRWIEAGRTARILVYEDGGHSLLSQASSVRDEIDSWLRRGEAPAAKESTAESSARASGAKAVRGELFVPRYGLSAVENEGWVYVYGGAPAGGRNTSEYASHGLLSSIERIDPTSLETSYIGDGLQRRANHDSLSLGTTIVSCGGRTQVALTRGRSASCETMHLGSGIFQQLPDLPTPLRTLGMVEIGDAIYAVGGLTDQDGFSSATFRLGPERSLWERLVTEMPEPREGRVVEVDGEVWAVGGYNGAAMATVMVFDPATETWQRRPDLPYPLSAFSTIVDGTDIYLFGDYERMSAIHRYETDTGEFYQLDQEISPRRHSAAVVVDGRVLVIGGNQTSTGPASGLIEAFALEDLRHDGKLVKAEAIP